MLQRIGTVPGLTNSMPAIINLTTFIDWDSSRRIVPPNLKRGSSTSNTIQVICSLQDAIAQVLSDFDFRNRYRVVFRLYHGWYRGKTKTPERINFEKDIQKMRIGRRIKNVSFVPDIQYNDYLLSDKEERHLIYDTLRSREDGNREEQKLVDTTLACDVLDFARFTKSEPIIIVGDDDDLLPCAFTARDWKCKTLILRIGRKSDNKCFDTQDIIKRI